MIRIPNALDQKEDEIDQEEELISKGFDEWYYHHFGNNPCPTWEIEVLIKRQCGLSWNAGIISEKLKQINAR